MLVSQIKLGLPVGAMWRNIRLKKNYSGRTLILCTLSKLIVPMGVFSECFGWQNLSWYWLLGDYSTSPNAFLDHTSKL